MHESSDLKKETVVATGRGPSSSNTERSNFKEESEGWRIPETNFQGPGTHFPRNLALCGLSAVCVHLIPRKGRFEMTVISESLPLLIEDGQYEGAHRPNYLSYLPLGARITPSAGALKLARKSQFVIPNVV